MDYKGNHLGAIGLQGEIFEKEKRPLKTKHGERVENFKKNYPNIWVTDP